MKSTEMNYDIEEQLLDIPSAEINTSSTPMTFTFINKCNFYKLFWIFIFGSIFGCYMEQIQYYLHKGIWESRAGVIWGPFSEIYGVGAVLMFLLSFKVVNTSPLTIFCTATVCGSAFEYFARLFQEVFFGSITWDYSKQPLNIGGRTSLKYGIYWGLLGLIFIKWVFPLVNKFLENIKGRMAFHFTWFLIVLISFDLLLSALAVNRWSERERGVPSEGYVDVFLDSHYGNDKMDYIFPHLKFIDTNKIT